MPDRPVEFLARLNAHLVRFGNVVSSFATSEIPEDLLRFCIVFLHSILEDTLRESIRYQYASGHTAWLEHVTLPHTEDRKNKYTIAELLKHYPDQTIEDIANVAANNHLARVSFSRTDEIVGWLKKVDIDPEPIRPFLDALAAGIERRHKIVHEADMSIDGTLAPISRRDMNHFFYAVFKVCFDVVGQLDGAVTGDQGLEDERDGLLERIRGD